MANVKVKGNNVTTSGELPKKGTVAPNFKLTMQDLSDKSLEDFGKKMKLLNIFPSLDTKTCSLSVINFNKKCEKIPNLAVLNISMDLPFAAARFCKEQEIENAITLSAFRSSFPKDYGVAIVDSPMKGLCARSVVILDEDNKVVYTELVEEITHEPNYDLAMKALLA
jgi:thiol peroxidase